ncbi:MAG: DUF1343 domain-containing protein [Candidatus Marinimicrobia bacterium]|jgi:uncharacterized protein YbbC (DUF1343 family)|nr:DUF1343 domain-containing protein [Candidatus Neomarinimicrobiota bacterium]MDD5709526.1 DUF1343 domain-containing protein [Candidatus Neomarinimicrobiota bacterium]MDX9778125.1 DUF1343 domain-containing protein [bacterium]
MKKASGVFSIALILLLAACSVRTGLDNAQKESFSMFHGKNIGVVANHTSVNREGIHIVDLLYANKDFNLKAILAPEHGYRGDVERGEYIAAQIDAQTGVPVYSIYGETRKPTSEMLAGLDALIFDIQDVGARFYTYISTMGNIMEAAAENGVPVWILDRPNPVGRMAEGPLMRDAHVSFVGLFPILLRHGMTIGELALMFRDQGWINAADQLELHIVRIRGWNPDKPYSKTGLPWIAPSPNIMNLNQALCYPGTCLFEGTNFSEGRGTLHPFEWIGAPWLDAEKLITELAKSAIPGIGMEAVEFTPRDIPGTAMDPKFEGELCRGIALKVTDPLHFPSLEFAVHLFTSLQTLHPEEFRISRPDFLAQLWGNRLLEEMTLAGKPAETILESCREERQQFLRLRENYLLY